MKFYLGIAGLGEYNAAAAIVNEHGEVVAAAEEERYTRIKFDSSFPINSIHFCLAKAGITIRDVDEVGYYFCPQLYQKERMIFGIRNICHAPDLLRKSFKFAKFNFIKTIIREKLQYEGAISLIPHHLCHAASAFMISPYQDATIVSIDGAGEWETSWIGYGKGKDIKHIESTLWPHSLGLVYSAFTQFLGFSYYTDQYKVMGLSAYGAPVYYDQFKEIMHISDDGRFEIDTSYFSYPHGSKTLFSKKCEKLFGKSNKVFIDPSERDKNLAASLQKRIEDCILAYVSRAIKLTGIRNVCIAGGVAMNCLAIGKIMQTGISNNVYLGPASSDAGCALGAACYLSSIRSGSYKRTALKNALLGNSFNTEEIRKILDQSNIDYTDCKEAIIERTAELIARGKIVGWFQGGTEYGQRALGARSILANPSIAEMKKIVNEKVKYRELFRPLAPSVLLNEVGKYFYNDETPSPYMTHTYLAKPGVIDLLPAVIHQDRTSRVHTVSREENGIYYDLIKSIGEKTGHPVVLNTSFNIKDEPLINTPLQAINCFLKTKLDALAIGSFLVEKK